MNEGEKTLMDWIYSHESKCCSAPIRVAWLGMSKTPTPETASSACEECGQLCEVIEPRQLRLDNAK